MTGLCGHLLSSTQYIFAIMDEPVSQRGYQSQVKPLTIWAGRALACARYTQDPNEERCRGLLDASGSAGVLSRGVGLRGFESHPPHHFLPGTYKQRWACCTVPEETWSFVTWASVRDVNSTVR